MTNPFSDSVQKDVWYPDDLPDLGKVELLSDAPVEADEVPHDEAQYGQWVEVDNGQGERWAAAPTELREFIGENYEELQDGGTFIVTSVQKGPADHDPYEVDVTLNPN